MKNVFSIVFRFLFPRTSEIQPLVTFAALIVVFIVNTDFRDTLIQWLKGEIDGVGTVVAIGLFVFFILLVMYYNLKIIVQHRKLVASEKYIILGFHYIVMTIVCFGYLTTYLIAANEAFESTGAVPYLNEWESANLSMVFYLCVLSFVRMVLLRYGGGHVQAAKRIAASLDDTQYGKLAIGVMIGLLIVLSVIVGMHYEGVTLLFLVIIYGQIAATVMQAVKDLINPPVYQ